MSTFVLGFGLGLISVCTLVGTLIVVLAAAPRRFATQAGGAGALPAVPGGQKPS